MTRADVPVAEEISDLAFHDLDLRTFPRSWPAPERRTAQRSGNWMSRTSRFLESDPEGCWVAEDETGVLGIATSTVRERLWLLATFAVRPGLQGRGVGRALLDRAQRHGTACDLGMLSASADPMALRRYHSAGFALHPQLLFRGEVDRSALPAVARLRDGREDDRDWMDDLDRRLRGGPHGPDHESLAETGRCVVAVDRSGYAYASASTCHLVAASTTTVAAGLLRECLAGAEGIFEIPHVTTANPWAVDVAMSARLAMWTSGYLAVRGMVPPSPYIHHGALM